MKAKQVGRQARATNDKAALRDKLEEGRTSPSVAKRLQGYDSGNPRCNNCVDFIGRGIVLTSNSSPKYAEMYCGLGHFSVKEGGCCDMWRGKDGAVLENPGKVEGH